MRIAAIDGIIALPDGFQLTVILDDEPDGLLSGVIQKWPLSPPGLRGLHIVRDQMVISTDLDVDAPARALEWLRGGPEPALDAMQRHADNLRDAAQQALARAQHVLRAPV